MTVTYVKSANAPACDIRTDDLTRHLYATDASLYEILPDAVAFPRSTDDVVAALGFAAEKNWAAIPRGAGTGLAGGAVGAGLVMDFSRNNRVIVDFNRDARTVRVGAGVVLDQLNAYLKPHGLWFGPDVATSSRATLGGMIANNSSGAHVPVYGTTGDHVRSLDVVLADGTVAKIGVGHFDLAPLHKAIDELVSEKADVIRERFHAALMKRWPGYGVDRYLLSGADLARIITGSEGTLACIFSAEIGLVPLPKRRGLCVICFETIAEAMQATMELRDLHPAAIEHIDDILFDQTREQMAFREGRGLLRLDDEPCKSILYVEFFDDIDEKLAQLEKRTLGLRKIILTDARQQEQVWAIRKAGLSLLTGRKGAEKPVPGIEDIAVAPEQLPAYIHDLSQLLGRMNLEGSYYGHAASGLMHVRPVLDPYSLDGRKKYRQLADEVSALVRQHKGSISAEHGVGIAHTEHLAEHLGPELVELMRDIKNVFDPKNCLNPGKIVPNGLAYRIDTNLRMPKGHAIETPFTPVLAFASKDESFVANLEQCNGCGGCRKSAPTMCPTFVATGDEIMSTRGRANTIRHVLEGKLDGQADPLLSQSLEEALSYCLSCKACTTECPSNVNLALLKAELLYARHQRYGLTFKDRAISTVDILGRIGCLMPGLANRVMRTPWARIMIGRILGFSAQRPLPLYATQRFDSWFKGRAATNAPLQKRGRVILWDDTWVRYHEPNIGKAAVAVLEAIGFEVVLATGRECCGRPAFSIGRLDVAKRYGEHNINLLQNSTEPIVFLEPSCYSMFKEDYRELKIAHADQLSKRAFLFEQFVENVLEREPDALTFQPGYSWVAIHNHCHTKALTDATAVTKLSRRLPNASVTVLNAGCCGMAGSFGQLNSKYDLSKKIAQPLVDQINALTAGTEIVACGTSCRHQIDHLTPVKPIHIAELLAGVLIFTSDSNKVC